MQIHSLLSESTVRVNTLLLYVTELFCKNSMLGSQNYGPLNENLAFLKKTGFFSKLIGVTMVTTTYSITSLCQ